MEEVLQKHVKIVLKNKEVLFGFVVVMEEDYIKVIDYDNCIIFINTSAIAYIKINNVRTENIEDVVSGDPLLDPNIKTYSEQTTERPDLAVIISKQRQNEFSMPSSNPDMAPCGPTPSFERQTKRGE